MRAVVFTMLQKQIRDPEASKPDDWDEDAPRRIVDEVSRLVCAVVIFHLASKVMLKQRPSSSPYFGVFGIGDEPLRATGYVFEAFCKVGVCVAQALVGTAPFFYIGYYSLQG